MINYVEFVGNIMDMTIEDVDRYYNEPPQSISTGDLPAAFPRLPQGFDAPIVFSTGSWPAMECDLVVVIQPFGQGTQSLNYSDALAMMDNVQYALRQNNSDLGNTRISWDIRMDTVSIGDVPYWAVVATVRDGTL